MFKILDQMTPEELNECAAVEVMCGAIFDHLGVDTWKFHGIVGIPIDAWKPSKDSNQIVTLEDELLSMGLALVTTQIPMGEVNYLSIEIKDKGQRFVLVENAPKETKNVTKLRSFIHAVRKLKELEIKEKA